MKNELTFPNVYRVTFTGSRKPAMISAKNFGHCEYKANLLCSKDAVETSILRIEYVGCIVV